MIKKEFFQNKAMTDILFGGESPYAYVFKEHLIFDEQCEFLNKLFKTNKSK